MSPAAPARVDPLAIAATNPLQNVGFKLLLLFLFFVFSRVLDVTVPWLHLPFLLSVAVLLATLATGGLGRVLASPIGRLLLAFTAWMVLCVPFSQWKGGSFFLLKETWLRSLLCFVMVAGLTLTLRQVRAVLVTVALAGATQGVLALVLQHRIAGRLGFPGGQFSNPNDLAQALLLSVPLLFLLGISAGNPFRKILIVGLALPLLAAVAQTGSRAAILAAPLVALYVFVRVPPATRVVMLIGGACFGLVAGAMLPDTLWARFRTLFDDTISTEEDSMAVASREARAELLKQSLKFTIRHPVFGVGPGVFQHASVVDSGAQGKRALWRETHNMFTQVSSECGMPGFVLYYATLWVCYRRLKALRVQSQGRPELNPLYAVVVCFSASLLGFTVMGLFSSVAYAFIFPTLLGVASALIPAGEAELARVEAERQAAAPGAARPVAASLPVPKPNRAPDAVPAATRRLTALERHRQTMSQRQP
jgi:O-antigen ligase